MKKFNFSKGLVIGLLTLALVLTGFATVKASAAAETKTITFKTNVEGSEAEYKVTYTPGKAAVVADPDNGIEAQDAVAPQFDAEKLSLNAILTALGNKDNCIYIKDGTPSYDPADSGVSFNSSDSSNQYFEIGVKAQSDVTVTIPVKSPKVTFNVTVIDLIKTGDASESTAAEKYYTYVAEGDFQKANKTVKVADILANAVNEDEEKLQDPTAWVVFGTIDPVNEVKFATDKFQLTADLANDRTVGFTVVSSKVPVSFEFNGFTSTFEVDNKKGSTAILFSDIVAGFKKTDAEGAVVGLEGENVIVKDAFPAATNSASGSTTTGKYATWKYTWMLDAVVNAAPDPVEITVSKIVPALEVVIGDDHIISGYDPDTDSIVFWSPVELTVYWADCKSTKGVQLKGSQLKSIDLKLNDDETAYVGSIPMNDKASGVKIAESKDAYIYASILAPAADKTKYSGNYIVNATPYKKVTLTFGYAQVEEKSTLGAIAAVTTIDTKKKTVVYSGETDEETNPNGLDQIYYDLQYSVDGTTWLSLEGNAKATDDFTSGKLYDLVNGESKTTLYFRVKGHAYEPAQEAVGTEGQDGYKEAVDAKNAYRATKAAKVTINAAKEAKAVKINVSTGTIALKNGYDFAMTDKETVKPTLDGTFTILPFNKGGKATEKKTVEGAEVDVASAFKETADFVPAKKCTKDTESMFTNIKLKSVEIDELATRCGKNYAGTGKLYIWVRKSASESKPAEKWTLITLDQVKGAPSIANEKGKDYYVAQAVDDTKGVIAAPEVKSASGDSNTGYEYLIVDAKDIAVTEGRVYANIDLTSAKWTALNEKGLTVGKSKSKYATEVGKKAAAVTLKEGSIVLVRRVGDKSSNLLPSEYLVTTVVKEEVTYKDDENKDQKKNLFVWKAYDAPAGE